MPGMCSPKRKMRVVIAGVLAMASAMSACGNSNSAPQNTERPLTIDEASMLSQTMYTNYDLGGATFEVATLTEPNGPQVSLRGVIDWKTHIGASLVSTDVEGAQISQVYWSDNVVGERRPMFDSTLVGMGVEPDPVIVRAPNMNLRLDQILSIITGLASEQPENAQLILQKPSTSFLRQDTLRNSPVTVMRYGERSIFWIEDSTGRMMRFEGNNTVGNMPIVIDFLTTEPQTVTLPNPQQTIASSQLNEIGQLLTTW